MITQICPSEVLFLRRPTTPLLADIFKEVDETPDYTDSDTNPNTTASSVAGDIPADGRKRRSEANQLRRSIFGKKHDRLGESKVASPSTRAIVEESNSDCFTGR